jgi:hypothetical protein
MKSSRKKIVRKKIRSKLSRKKRRSKAKIKKVKGGGPTPKIDDYNTLVFDIDGTILPGLCKDGSYYDKHKDTYSNYKTPKNYKAKQKMKEYSEKMINRIKEYKDQILTLITLLLEIKKKKKNIKLVILTRCWLKYTLQNFHPLYYEPELTVRELFEDNLTPGEWEEIFEKIITERGRVGFKFKMVDSEVVGITHTTNKNPLHQEIMWGHNTSGFYEISIIFILELFFDDFYDMSKLEYNRNEALVKKQHKSPFWSAFVKASYFENFVLDQDKNKVLFFDDEYINTMFVDGLGYDCVIPTETVKKQTEKPWMVKWVNDALEYLLGIGDFACDNVPGNQNFVKITSTAVTPLNIPYVVGDLVTVEKVDPAAPGVVIRTACKISSMVDDGGQVKVNLTQPNGTAVVIPLSNSVKIRKTSYFITSEMDHEEKKKYKEKAITDMTNDSRAPSINFTNESDETLFRGLYDQFMALTDILFYKCYAPNLCNSY